MYDQALKLFVKIVVLSGAMALSVSFAHLIPSINKDKDKHRVNINLENK